MYKEILVPLMPGSPDEQALRQACALAGVQQGHVAALVAVGLAAPIAAAWIYYPTGVYESMQEAANATVRDLARAAEQRLEKEGVSHEVRQASSFLFTVAEIAALHARHADLVIAGVSRPVPDEQWRLLSGLLAGSGRPLLIAPEDAPARASFGRVLVAWNTSREATRAVHDALPLLTSAREVEVLRVARAGEAPPLVPDAALIAHLRRHGIEAAMTHRTAPRANTGEAIIAHASDTGAELIVAGAYSHSRAREQVFGGVTRRLIEHAGVPVLFAH